MTYFFFYNNLTNENLINKIEESPIIQNGYIYVKLFDKDNANLILDANEKPQILEGKLINFKLSLADILLKLTHINEIKYKNKDTYIMELVDVYLFDETNIKAYLIY